MATPVTNDATFGSPQRQRILRYAVLLMAIVYVGRLGYLQIVQGNVYRLKAEAQAIKAVKIEPFRGNMIDRNGRFVVQNAPGFSITVTPYEFTDESAQRLSRILGVPDSVIWADVHRAAAFNKFNPAKISAGRDIGADIIGAIEEQRDALPGVDIIIDPKRLYAFQGNSSHLFGYTREVSEWQLGQLGDAYDPGDMIGQTGLERSYEEQIRGQKGLQFVAVNKNGQRVASFNEGKSDVGAKEGFDLFLGLDMDVQEVADRMLDGKRGGAVAIDPSNGEILAFVSKPDFDIRQFTGKTSRSYYNSLARDPENPLFNRASMPQYSPGSTWKPLMALAGLQEGVISDKSTLYCAGGFTFGNRTCKCHGGVHGSIAVKDALAVSCNAFFNQVAVKLGIEKHHYWASMFGFGEKTRADITEEGRGKNPSREWLNRVYGERGWTNYVLVNWGIGQGEVAVTPLQMAAYTAAIANEGTWYQPHVVRATFNKAINKRLDVAYDSHVIPIDKQHFKTVKEGMRRVVTNGTSRGADIPGLDVCGKTGTAEVRGQKDQSWFICFAPKDNPKIAICVSVESGGFGAASALPIARAMLEMYFHRKWPEGVTRDTSWRMMTGTVPSVPPTSAPSAPSPEEPKPRGPFFAPRSVQQHERRSVESRSPVVAATR
ncbi:MAG TPA: penicillin-binding protein 2 [Chlorobiota bacterium]|nr:penicillin-binding protein 2 [Chlorobiota bacterium]